MLKVQLRGRDNTWAAGDPAPPPGRLGAVTVPGTPVHSRFPPAGHGLCGRQGSSAEAAAEDAEGPDAESSDDADHSSKVSGFRFRLRDSARARHRCHTCGRSPQGPSGFGSNCCGARWEIREAASLTEAQVGGSPVPEWEPASLHSRVET